MNEKIAKLISRVAAATGYPKDVLKRVWYKTPWRERAALRRQMKQEIAARRQKEQQGP